MKAYRVTLHWNGGEFLQDDFDTLAEAVTFADEQSDQGENAVWRIQRWALTGEHIQDDEGEWHEEYQLKPYCQSEGWRVYVVPARDMDDIPF